MDAQVIITRQQAQVLGLTRYVSDKPCKRGHVGERTVSGNRCIECQKKIRRTRSDTGPHRDSGQLDKNFDRDPGQWADDGGAKRVAVYDRNFDPPRLMRKVGWVNCLGRFSVDEPHRIFSPDVVRFRICRRCKADVRTDYD